MAREGLKGRIPRKLHPFDSRPRPFEDTTEERRGGAVTVTPPPCRRHPMTWMWTRSTPTLLGGFPQLTISEHRLFVNLFTLVHLTVPISSEPELEPKNAVPNSGSWSR